MDRSNNNVWLHRFAWALAVATLFLVGLGGVVTTKGVGMAVPDWPTTYGHHMFFFPFAHWYAGVFDEHSHRVWASIVGILAAVFAIWAWARDSSGRERWWGIAAMVAGLGLAGVRKPALFVAVACLCVGVIAWAIPRATTDTKRLRWLGVIMFAAVIIQGVLGGLRVVLDTYGWGTEFGILHATLAQIFFLLVCSLALVTSKWWSRTNIELNGAAAIRMRRLFAVTTFLIFIQLILGATMRHQHAGLAVPDFPLAYGKIWPDMDPESIHAYNAHRVETGGEKAIAAPHIVYHMLHRYTAFGVLFAILACAVAAWRNTSRGSILRKGAGLWVAMTLIQVGLGILTVLSDRKVDVTTAHVAIGALTFMVGWLLVLMTSRAVATEAASAPRPEAVLSRRAELEHA